MTYKLLGSPSFCHSNKFVTTYDGSKLDVLGSCILDATCRHTLKSLPFTFLHEPTTKNIFGLDIFDIFGFEIQNTVSHIASCTLAHNVRALC